MPSKKQAFKDILYVTPKKVELDVSKAEQTVIFDLEKTKDEFVDNIDDARFNQAGNKDLTGNFFAVITVNVQGKTNTDPPKPCPGDKVYSEDIQEKLKTFCKWQ